MSEKPILFSTEMVRAILEGRKTQTRRVIKPQPEGAHMLIDREGGYYWFMCGMGDPVTRSFIDWVEKVKARYQPGDLLWVKENWGVPIMLCGRQIVYRADYSENKKGPLAEGEGWRSSRYMPKAASRIWLEVADDWAEQAQDITPDGARAEGFASRAAFAQHWDKLNEKRGFGYDLNPWVEAVAFQVLSTEGRP